MKKQIMRYRLIADQKVGRANKSEVLSEELLQVEKHIEHVRTACQSTYKKMSHTMQSHGASDYDKRLKRLSENTLAQAMNDACASLQADNDSFPGLGSTFEICAKAQSELAKEKAMYELFLDEHIITPLQTLVDTEIPAIMKQREKLKRLVLDRDNAQQNFHKAQKAQNLPNANPTQASAKVEATREEYDQATYRMEQCKDQLVTEMFEYLSKEVGHSQRIADFYLKQLDYHRRCVSLLEKLEPEMKSVQEKTVVNTSFGRPLAEHLRSTERTIASPIEACALFLLEYGLKEEGIFRIAGGAAKLKKIRSVVDGGVLDLLTYDAQDDVHAVAGVLKQYLRDLPEPLLTHKLHDKWVALSNSSGDHEQRLASIKAVMIELPAENYANLRYLIKFVALVAEHCDINKMTASNLAVVLAPNLLWSHVDDISKRMVLSNILTSIVETIISNAAWFFPDDINFVVTPNATSYNLNYRDGNSSNESKSQSFTATQPTPAPASPILSHKSMKPTTQNVALPAGDICPPIDNSTSSAALKSKKYKSKAPPPPQSQPPPPKPQDRSPLSLPPPASANTNGNSAAKPSAATRRVSMRKPHMPPPPNPKDNAGGVGPVAPGNSGMPVPRPRPPVRKSTGPASCLIDPPPPNPKFQAFNQNLDSIPQSEENSEAYSPPMPSSPPPPLPADVELDLGAALTSSLSINDY